MRNPKEILEEIKKLVNSQGYIYALLLVLFEDFHIPNFYGQCNRQVI